MITPIGDERSDDRELADGLIALLEPLLDEFGYKITAAHRISATGSITAQIIDLLVNSELVIANLTGLNNNVMYELGVRHATGKHVITIAENGTKLPFDVAQERTIFYSDKITQSIKLTDSIKLFISELKENVLSDNPVTNQIQRAAIAHSGVLDEPSKLIYRQLELLAAGISQLQLQAGRGSEEFSRVEVQLFYKNVAQEDTDKIYQLLEREGYVKIKMFSTEKGTYFIYIINTSSQFSSQERIIAWFEWEGISLPERVIISKAV